MTKAQAEALVKDNPAVYAFFPMTIYIEGEKIASWESVYDRRTYKTVWKSRIRKYKEKENHNGAY